MSKTAAQPRAVGAAKVVVWADKARKTRIKDLRNAGSSKLVFPQSQRNDMETVLVNTAGGITGGDRFDLDVTVQQGADLTLTTQAAERAYRAQPGEIGRVTTRLTVDAGARLNWLPQELILFDRCALYRQLEISLAPDAQLLMVEPLVFGRTAMDETLHDVVFQDRIRIRRGGLPLYFDGLNLQGNAARHLARPTTANGAGAMASVVAVGPNMSGHLSSVRSFLPDTAGASLLADDVLVIRQLAVDSYELRRTLIPMLEHLSQTTLPKSWRL